MSDLPRVTLRVVGSTEKSSTLMHTQRVYAVVDGEVIGEFAVNTVEIHMQAGEAPMVLLKTFVGPNYVEIDLHPDREAVA